MTRTDAKRMYLIDTKGLEQSIMLDSPVIVVGGPSFKESVSQDRDGFWPSVYTVSDHGNAVPVTFKESKVVVDEIDDDDEDFPAVEKMRRKKPKKSQVDKEKPSRKTEAISRPRFIWRIVRDHLVEETPGLVESQVGLSNAKGAEQIINEIRAKRGIVRSFRLFDGDGVLCYTGEMTVTDGSDPMLSDDPMDPLDVFKDVSGCTEMKVRKGGTWETL